MPGVHGGIEDGPPYGYGSYDQNGYDPYSRRDYPDRMRDPVNPYPPKEDLYSRAHKPNGYGPPHGISSSEYGYNSRGGYTQENGYGGSEYHQDAQSLNSRDDRDRMGNPVYELDHLCTLTVGSREGVLFPEDGIRKLRAMELQSGIWTMRCKLIIEKKQLVIVDGNTSEEMEHFPIHLVNEPTAVMNHDRKDIYNNIVLFIVLEDPKKKGVNPSEMHIFQCINRPAQEVVDGIKSVKMGRGPQRGPPPQSGYREPIPPPPVNPAPEPPVNGRGGGYYESRPPRPSHYGPPQRRSAMLRDMETESTTSERTDRDVQLLNHCFDDIERFVAGLQSAAEAFKELQRRQKQRGKSKRHVGEGMLTMRARPPPPEEFMGIFAKFKLSFNLLAKLKAHIHDPNAPELVHFLFTPLSLVVEASKDPRHGSPDLAGKVVSPLLTRDAIELLRYCLTSKETELWMSLGDAWTVTRDQWQGYVAPYIPRFSDGWQPPIPVNQDDDANSAIAQAVSNHAAQIRNRERASHAVGHPDEMFGYPPDDRVRRQDSYREIQRRESSNYGNRQAHHQPREEPHYDRRPPPAPAPPPPEPPRQLTYEEKQMQFLRACRAKGARVMEVIHERTGRNNRELTVQKGEYLEVVDSSRNWWKLRNSQGQLGHAPYTILKEVKDDDSPGFAPQPPNQGPSRDQPDYTMDRNRPYSGNYSSHIPPPPGPPPPGPPPPGNSNWQLKKPPQGREEERPKKHENRKSHHDQIHDELKMHLTKGKNRNVVAKPKAKNRASNIYLTEHSTRGEVKEWLESKGFGDRAVYSLETMNGKELFSLTQRQMENVCGRDEGQRLYSQITVQKNLSGYETKGAKELNAILQRRKERADSHSTDGSYGNGNYLGTPPDYSPETPPMDSGNTSEASSDQEPDYDYDDIQNGSRTLRDLLRRQRKKIMQ